MLRVGEGEFLNRPFDKLRMAELWVGFGFVDVECGWRSYAFPLNLTFSPGRRDGSWCDGFEGGGLVSSGCCR